MTFFYLNLINKLKRSVQMKKENDNSTEKCEEILAHIKKEQEE